MRFGDSVNSVKQVGRHWPNISNEGTEVQMSQNLGFNVDAGRDLDQFETLGDQPEDGSFRNDQNIALAFSRDQAAERDLFDRLHEFTIRPFSNNDQLAISTVDFQPT